jgi:serine/threonine protein phosphatase 1
MSRLIAIGDVHGCASELLTLLERLELTPDTTVVFVGDYVDRGPHGRQVIDLVLETNERCRVVPLLGNHELMFLDFLFDRNLETAGLFVFNGGAQTLGSYADDSGDFLVPQEHIEFMRGLDMTYQTEGFFFVHAGVPDLPLEQIEPSIHALDLLWARDFLRSSYRWSKAVVHGHSPVKKVEIRPNRINVDTGCAYHQCLSAIDLSTMRVTSVPRLDSVRGTVLCDRSSRRRAVRFRGALPVDVCRGDEVIEFETLDYSPIGLFIRLVSPCERKPLAVNDVIFGTIGKGQPGSVLFRGVVVRELSNQQGLFYGVQISHID